MRHKCILLCGLGLFGLGTLVAAAARGATAEDLLFSQLTAERHGLTRAWYLQLPVSGVRAHVTSVVPDHDLLFIGTDAAMIFAVEAETGRLVWSAQVGNPKSPTLRPAGNGPLLLKPAPQAAGGDTSPGDAANSDAAKSDAAAAEPGNANPAPAADASPGATFKAADGKPKPLLKVVAIVNGTDLYLLNRSDGLPLLDEKSHQEWKVSLRNTPIAGPAVSDQFVYVPTAGSRVEIYDITDLKDGVKYGNGSGDVPVPPVRFGNARVAWCSDKGVVSLTLPDGTTARGVETGESVAAPIAAEWPHVYVGTLSGSLFSIPESGDQYFWKFAAGSPIRQRPIGLADAVYVLPEDGGMFRIAPADGKPEWFSPDSRRFLAASPTKVYTVDGLGRMLVLDAKTSNIVDAISLPAAVEPVANAQTDRILLASADGLLQSLHEVELTEPRDYVTEPKPPPPPEPPAAKPKPKPPAEKPKPKEESDTPAPAQPPKAAAPKPPATKPTTPHTRRGKNPPPGK